LERNIAVLVDFDNIAKGSKQEGLGDFDIRVVIRRLREMGRILVARAYCDWERWSRHRREMAENGVTMVELTVHGHGDKNRGDIALAVDAMEMAYSRNYLDTFVILSGDSDFTPLVMRLKELNRRVIGIGTRGSTSRLIANVCDEFIYYDTLLRTLTAADDGGGADEGSGELSREGAFALLVEALESLQREEPGPVHGSVVKTAMKRKAPTFAEEALGYRTFARFLDKAAEAGHVVLSRDARAGGYQVDLPSSSAAHDAAPETEVGRLYELLADEGLDIGESAARRAAAEALVEACAERTAKNRKCAVQYLLGDLGRRGLPGGARGLKGFMAALVRAGALRHPDGDPVRAPTAPFVPPESADGLLLSLAHAALDVLAARGASPSPEALAEMFPGLSPDAIAGEDRPARVVAAEVVGSVEAETAPDVQGAGAGPRRRRSRRGGRRRRGSGGAEGRPVEDGGVDPAEPDLGGEGG
jgi:uncharacterized protein (TIGR00288 family)